MKRLRKKNPKDPERARIYNIWTLMRYRCSSPKCAGYKYYGARGISVCSEWELFENFYQWSMTHGYDQSLTIDRINSDGNYEPNNCRWVDYSTQAKNKRKANVYRGRHHSVVQLSMNNEYIASYFSVREAARSVGASDHKNIVLCCQRKQNKAYGFKWMYEDEYRKENANEEY